MPGRTRVFLERCTVLTVVNDTLHCAPMLLFEALNAACRGAMLHIDMPTPEEFRSLAAIKGDVCVSLYVPSDPLRAHEHQNRLAVENLAADALRQLNEATMEKRKVAALEEQLRHLTRPGEGSTCWRCPRRMSGWCVRS